MMEELEGNDDFSGGYLEAKQNAASMSIEERLKAQIGYEEPQPEPEKIPESIGRNVTEIASGKPFAAGINQAISNTLSLGEDIDNFFLSKGIDFPVLQISDPATGEFDIDLVKRSEFNQKLEEAGTQNKLKQFIDSETVGGKLVQDITAFLVDFAGAGKFIKAPDKASKAIKYGAEAAKGAVADFLAFEGSSGRLTDLAKEYGFETELTDFLESDEDDTELEGRLKNAVEGLGLGLLVDPTMKAFKAVREANKARIQKNKLAETAEKAKELADIEPEMVSLDIGKPEEPAFKLTTPKEALAKTKKTVGKEGAPIAVEDLGEGVSGETPAPDEAALNINLSRLNTTEDVQEVIEGVGKKFASTINESRRQQITFEETQKLADDLGMSVEKLMDRRKGQAFNAEELLASRMILVSSGEQLTKLARDIQAKGAEVSAADLVKFERAMQQHKAIQAQVSGATAEAGRALSQFRIIAKSAREQQQLIDEALNTTGGKTVALEKVKALANLKDPAQINKAANQMAYATTKEMVYEAWINGLLTNPATHTANILSNAATLMSTPGERWIAAKLGQLQGDQAIPNGEASAMIVGMMNALPDAFRVMSQTFKTGIPQSQIQKIENIQRVSITGENVEAALRRSPIGKAKRSLSGQELNLNGTMGRAVDYFGEVMRGSGRLLSASDDFFQLIAYRAELNAQAYRQAVGEGLQGEALARRVQDIVANPPENIHSSATNFQHYATFTDEMGDIGKAFSAGARAIPAGRVIMPFIRTPSRVFAYAMERTPVAPLMGTRKGAGVGSQIREDIMAGGARRDMALAKMAAGSWTMAMGAELAMSGFITGNGPENPDARRIWLETHQPYSIKIGGEWFAYNRMDPLAMPIGIAADITEAIGEMDEATAMDIANTAVMGTASNMLSKSYVKGLSDIFTAILEAKTDPDSKNVQARGIIENWIGSIIPSGVAAVARLEDPVLRSTYDADPTIQALNKIKSRIPGLSKDLKPRVNMFGEVIVLGGGLGPDIMSPIYTNEVKEDPLIDELIRLQVPLRMPGRSIKGVQLTHDEYYRYNMLAGKEIEANGKNLKQTLEKLINSSQYQKGTDGPDGSKALMVQTVYSNFKQAAQAQMIKESKYEENGLYQRIIDNKQEKANLLGF